MKTAQKKRTTLTAYELGAGSPVEAQLKLEGKIACRDGKYFLASLEGVQKASAGDFFKVTRLNGENFPYPNSREFFLANHRKLRGDLYEQLTKPLKVWFKGDSLDEPEMKFLLEDSKLTLEPQDPAHYFKTFLWGAPLDADEDAALIFYDVQRDDSGAITAIDFNLVNREIFNRDYELL